MLFPTLVAGGFSFLMAVASDVAAEQIALAEADQAVPSVTQPAGVDRALPSVEMAEQFDAYLAWTKEQGLSRLAAFETLSPEQIHRSPNLSGQFPLPTAVMTEQFNAYLQWTREQNLGRFYAFQTRDFD
jgi:predicted YcjX-like family ATPase